MSITIDEARAAKKKAAQLVGAAATVVGIGLTSRHGSFAVKVNLQAAAEADLPSEVDGVPIVYEVVGAITARRD